ncbi:glycosyl hydrolase [Chitinophagaceae bacterium LB-8]|uniref:Glycosyl hydrolase n=1 Tax=Paraflavisolibacter caeni TaxID=2982496 RepID=A0A9X2Y1J2_9BACT|nr:glycosyl hydrolase [Paraflavisolibacter caeni]MCU7551583.1 glycosyl hydrolase [Paraflavisolibacter caeni]
MKRFFLVSILFILATALAQSQEAKPSVVEGNSYHQLYKNFKTPPERAKPWVFWYWMYSSVSKSGITADLEAMKKAGIGGAYLMPIKGATNPPLFTPVVEQLSPLWWDMVRHSMKEADRLGLKMAMNACDGFTTAGGPWITPELSMQKVVWTETFVEGGQTFNNILSQPETNENYYKDIAVFAIPTKDDYQQTSYTNVPKVTSSISGVNPQFLVEKSNKEYFRSDDSCWIQYEFSQPFTCRSLKIKSDGKNYYSNLLRIEASDDGKNFRYVTKLEPPRQGWQDYIAELTHAIPPTTARYFRFYYSKEGAEPGAEDLDAAKWKPIFKIMGIEMFSAPKLQQFEGKTGEVWRVSKRTSTQQISDALCVPIDKIINLTAQLDKDGRLHWAAPAGKWTILRIGHTSTGKTNYIGGKGKGLECDKFNPKAAEIQFDGWYGEAIRQIGADLAARVLKIFHVDSWECGSQNWSTVFLEEFKRRRGYDLLPYLPVMAGVPVENADVSERFLHDVRETINELVSDNFYKTMAQFAHKYGVSFSGESVAPTMTGDGMQHNASLDIPMGEFWLNSPSHDKPFDIMDAVSGAHIYGKNLIMAEAFTTVRMAWDEHPGILKPVGDRNYAMGINKFVIHVFAQNPWMDRKPGMTLDGVGLYFQRDQTWWNSGRAWVQYLQRCQALLQEGKPVVDIAVFTGEEMPRRALLPDRLVSTLPGIFGKEVVEREAIRLANKGWPSRQKPAGVTISANMADPENWVDPLKGYAYDSYNKDALIRLSKISNGRIELPGGAAYQMLVIPGVHSLLPDSQLMSPEVATKLEQLVKEGATVMITDKPQNSPGLQNFLKSDHEVKTIGNELFSGEKSKASKASADTISMWNVGKGRVIKGPYKGSSFNGLGIARDMEAKEDLDELANGIAWTHRRGQDFDIYFISNQKDKERVVTLSLRINSKQPELWDPLTGEIRNARDWKIDNGRTIVPLKLAPYGSIFIVFNHNATAKESKTGKNWLELKTKQSLNKQWVVSFDTAFGGPKGKVIFNQLENWSKNIDSGIHYYSGTAVYTKSFQWNNVNAKERVFLDLGKVANIAEVKLNGVSCGIAWTFPYQVEITGSLKKGNNNISIEVSNTWANRLIGDQRLPVDKRVTRTTAPFRLEGKPLLEAGLLGPVVIKTGTKQ